MKTFQFLMTVAVMLAATMIGGCSANVQMAQENATLKAKLAEREREDAKLRSQLLAPDGSSSTQLSSREAEAALGTPGAPDSGWKTKTLPTAPATPAIAPFVPAPAFQQGGTVGPGAGYLNRDPMNGLPCSGMCLALLTPPPPGPRFYMQILIDSREMTVFAGYARVIRRANVAKLGGGREVRRASFVPPYKTVKTVMDWPGNHDITVLLYTEIPGQSELQPVGVWEKTERFPYQSGGQSYPWGASMTVYGPSRDIDTY